MSRFHISSLSLIIALGLALLQGSTAFAQSTPSSPPPPPTPPYYDSGAL